MKGRIQETKSKKYIKTGRDFAKIFTAMFFNHTQSEYYGNNQSAPNEGIAVNNVFLKQNCSKNSISSYQNCSIFHSFMSDGSSKYGATKSAHTKKLLQWLLKNTYIYTTRNSIWEDIYGCSEQYICATVLYLFLLLAHDF